ncbi:MAG: MarR family winged helix-turn-helix transcriptional regulator [Novosphingobium sp.]
MTAANGRLVGEANGSHTSIAATPSNGHIAPATLEDSRSNQQSGDLHDLAARLVAQADELLAIAARLNAGSGAPPVAGEVGLMRSLGMHSLEAIPSDETNWADLARAQYRDRRLRGQLFEDAALFGEPAWDLLLDLFIAARERKQVPVTSACIGAAVPTTTALRWLTVLEAQGLVIRENDASDARRVFVRLSSDAYARMTEYFRRSSRGPRVESPALPRMTGQGGFMFPARVT